MLPFFLVNALIVGLIIAVLVITSNPLAIFGLMFLVQMPYEQREDQGGEDEDQPMGFTANVK